MFRTELTIAPATGQLPRTARVITIGSCFADSIGSRLAANKVETLVNPFGTVFQPLALGRLLRAAAGEDVDWQQHLVEARGRWQSYDLHGSIGADSPVELLQIIHEIVQRTGDFLRQADLVLLTLGTAWAYRLRETGELVSNCHKQSPDLFVRELLTPDEIINALAETHDYLRRINPELRFVVTVSPVRHLKDTLPLNSVSKSVLRVATHIVSDVLPGVAYFPAYELLVDDLRDYRFYASDMLHPSEVAEDYIWDKFARTYFDADFGRFRKEWAGVRQSLGHRPLHAGAPEHRQFLESTREKLEQLSLRKVEVADELQAVRTQLAALPVPRQPEPVAIPEDDVERIDIGEGATGTETVGITAQPKSHSPELTGERPPRLSPEEFRAQRGARSGRPERNRRDGRGKSQRGVATENEQFQAAAFAEEQPEVLISIPPVLSVNASRNSQSDNSALTPASADLDLAADGEDSEKKKKRRSRGGAKRTARKNALRLAAGELLPESETSNSLIGKVEAAGSIAVSEITGKPSESPKLSVITKPEPGKRSGRRNEPGRGPRAALFAIATELPVVTNSPLPADEELPTSGALVPRIADIAALGSLPKAGGKAALENPRDGRNQNSRGKRGENRAEVSNAPTNSVSTVSAPTEVVRNPTNNAVLPLIGTNELTETIASTAPAKTNKPNRAKRMVSAARSEKPAVDVPVIPIQNVQLRNQVAAGRMTGTSASLVVPAIAKASVKKAAAAAVPVAAAMVPNLAPMTKPKLAKKPGGTMRKPVMAAAVENVLPKSMAGIAKGKTLKREGPAAPVITPDTAKAVGKPKAKPAISAPAAKPTAKPAAAKPPKPTNQPVAAAKPTRPKVKTQKKPTKPA